MNKRIFSFLVLAFFLSLYFLTAPGYMYSVDGLARYEVAKSILDGHGSSIPHPASSKLFVVRGKDGRDYSYFGLGQSLAYIPLYLLGKVFSRFPGGYPKEDIYEFFCSFLNPIEMALLCTIVVLVALALGYSRKTSFLIALVFGLGTIAWAHSRDNFDHVQEALCILIAFLFLLYHSKTNSLLHVFFSGFFVGLAFITRINVVIAIPGLLFYCLLLDLKKSNFFNLLRKSSLFAAGFLPWLCLFFYYNYTRFGNVLETGYNLLFAKHNTDIFSIPAYMGLYKFLLSPGRGLFLYSLVTILFILTFRDFFKRNALLAISFLIVILIYIAFYVKFVAISAWAWGPRQLLAIIPLMVIPIGEYFENWKSISKVTKVLVLGIIILSIVIQIPAASVSSFRPTLEAVSQGVGDDEITFNPKYFPLLGQFRNFYKAFSNMKNVKHYEFKPDSSEPKILLDKLITLNIFNWWWILTYYRGIKVVIIVPLLLIAGLMITLFKIKQSSALG